MQPVERMSRAGPYGTDYTISNIPYFGQKVKSHGRYKNARALESSRHLRLHVVTNRSSGGAAMICEALVQCVGGLQVSER
jgi:hypothetical protein